MIEKNAVYTMTITGTGTEGEGVGKVDGFTVFVPDTLLGEEIEVLIVKVLKNYAYGKLMAVIKPSKHRVQPECPYFYQCGGCTFWHTDYSYELDYKTRKVQDCLRRIGKLDMPIEDCIGNEEIQRYRNKALFPVTSAGIGFFAPRSHRLIPVEQCRIQHTINDKILQVVAGYMQEFAIPGYDEASHTGTVRNIFTRTAAATGEVMVAIVTRTPDLPHKQVLIQRLTEAGATSIIQNINPNKTNVALGKESIQLYGKPYITDKIGDLMFEISLHSFYQVNPVQTKRLYDKVVEFAEFHGTETVFDLYCGIGTIALYVARHVKKVIGVECVPAAIENAKRNAELNGIQNADFLVGKTEEEAKKLGRADVVIVDPPRKGCDMALLQAMRDIAPEKIVYVSCNPATLARDLQILQEFGYTTVKAQPLDMFHRTAHVETVVLMSRKDK